MMHFNFPIFEYYTKTEWQLFFFLDYTGKQSQLEIGEIYWRNINIEL